MRENHVQYPTRTLMPSKKKARIDPRFSCFALVVKKSRLHGRGVFAAEEIPAKRKVIEYTGEVISASEANDRDTSVVTYLFTLSRRRVVDGSVGGSGAEYVNHSCEPNLFVRIIKGHILYMSRRRIPIGEELTVDYRFSANVAVVPCNCGSPVCRGTINLKRRVPKKRRRTKRPSSPTPTAVN